MTEPDPVIAYVTCGIFAFVHLLRLAIRYRRSCLNRTKDENKKKISSKVQCVAATPEDDQEIDGENGLEGNVKSSRRNIIKQQLSCVEEEEDSSEEEKRIVE